MSFVAIIALAACSNGADSGVADDTPGSTDDGTTTTAADSAEPDATPAPADEPTDTSAPEPADVPVTTVPRPTTPLLTVDEDGTIVEADVPAPGPTSFDEVVDAGIEAGNWDEIEGLTRVLGWVLGQVAADQVPGVTEVLHPGLDEVLDRANALALGGAHTDEELATLRTYYEVFAPSPEALDSSPRVTPTGFAGLRSVPRQDASASGCAPVDPTDWDADVVFASCYDVLEDEVEGARLRVFVPRSFADDPVALNLGPVALGALGDSVRAYQDLGTIGDMDLILSDVQMSGADGVGGTATVTAQWDMETVVGCPISIFGNAWGSSPEAFEQIVAHEAWHCVQHYDGYPMAVPDGTAWYREGGAHFFSNVVYPSHDYEWGTIDTFDYRSTFRPLHELSYDAWMWWQYLGRQRGERYVADLHRSMMEAGGNGVALIDGLDETFHNFVVEFAAGNLKDQDGKSLPRARRYITIDPDVSKNDAGRKIEMKANRYVGAKFHLAYAKELRVFQTDATSTGGRYSSAEWEERLSLPSWQGVAPEVRSKCDDRSRYAFVGTSFVGDQTFTVQIDKVEEAACDPCVLGTWSLQLDTFRSMIENAVAAQGAAFPPGVSWSFGGAYYVQFVDQEVVREQRDGLQIMFGMEGMGEFSITVDSYATGTYSADGERLTVNDLVESFNRVTTSLPFGGEYSFPSAIDQGTGSYVCDDDVLTITVDGYDPVVWDRVDKILEPPAGDVTATGE